MEESVSSETTLMQRIRQLEQERDELQFDVEQLCMQRSGMPSKVNISQIQARRISGLEREMEEWKQKLQACTVKNQKLHDELSEAKQIKAHFADLLKSETDKNLELGKEVTYFQGKATAALVERDRALFQVEKCLEEEKRLNDKVHQLQKRLELVTSDLLTQKKCFQDLQDEANAKLEESGKLHNVVDFFWRIRSRLSDCGHAQNIGDKVTVLLQDSESSWAYGDTIQELERLRLKAIESEAATAASQKDICAANELVITLQRQLEEETISKEHAREQSILLEQNLLHLTVVIGGKLRRFHLVIAGLKEEMTRTLKEGKDWVDSLMAAWVALSINSIPTSQTDEQFTGVERKSTTGNLCEITEMVGDRDAVFESSVNEESATSRKTLPIEGYESEVRDMKEALAIALEEKVAALLLLSQQEERHISEVNLISVREKKIAELQKQLLQVTIDKGDALIQVANLMEELAMQAECSGINHDRTCDRKHTSFQSTLKSWFRGSANKGFKFDVHTFLGTRVKNNPSLTRLQADNSFLWSVLLKLHKLISSVNSLHQILVKVRDHVPNGCSITGTNDAEQLDFVMHEARHLIVAVGGSLPAVGYKDQRHTEITVEDADGTSFYAFDHRGTGTELLSTIGRASLESILFCAEILKENVLYKQRKA